MSHPSAGLDDVVHQRIRLGVLTVLAQVRRADFRYLRETLDLTDGNLSRHLAVLEQAALVEVEKVFEGKRPRTWIELTAAGSRALETELDALQRLIDAARPRG